MIASGVNMDLLLDLAPQVLSRLASHTSGSTVNPKELYTTMLLLLPELSNAHQP